MRCPRCGLVHASGELYCRRCMVNMHTGEPMPETPVVQAVPLGERLSRGGQAALVSAAAGIKRLESLRGFADAAIAKVKSVNLLDRLKSVVSRTGGLKSIPCLQCEGNMKIERMGSYGSSGIIALIVLGIILLGLGFLAWPLFITGAAALALAVYYRRQGKTRWRCPSCGFTVSRR